MIDLRFKELPHTLICDGVEYELDTDFRTWIHFDYLLREERQYWEGIFKDEVPISFDWFEPALEFLESKNVTPHDTEKSLEKLLDYVLDGDYIVAAFQQAYGIDLTSVDMHWHRFHALLIGLPDDVLLSKAIFYRGWKKEPQNKDHDRKYRENKARWSFPPKDDEERRAAILEWAESFFG